MGKIVILRGPPTAVACGWQLWVGLEGSLVLRLVGTGRYSKRPFFSLVRFVPGFVEVDQVVPRLRRVRMLVTEQHTLANCMGYLPASMRFFKRGWSRKGFQTGSS